jgi:hypothetical protein
MTLLRATEKRAKEKGVFTPFSSLVKKWRDLSEWYKKRIRSR